MRGEEGRKGMPFTAIEIDSILSKLIQGRHATRQLRLSTEALTKADKYIVSLEDNNEVLIKLLETEKQMGFNSKEFYEKELKIQKKQSLYRSLKWGGIGIGFGALLTALII